MAYSRVPPPPQKKKEKKRTTCYFNLYTGAVAKGVYALRALDRDFSLVDHDRHIRLKAFVYVRARPEPRCVTCTPPTVSCLTEVLIVMRDNVLKTALVSGLDPKPADVKT